MAMPLRKQQALEEERRWQDLFRTTVAARLSSAIQDVRRVIGDLNLQLKKPIGDSQYHIRVDDNPAKEFQEYRRVLEVCSITQDPEVERRELAVLFLQAEASRVPAQFESGWMEFCRGMADAAESGASVKPFDRGRPEQTRLILDSLPRILAWPGESLVRFASAVLFGDSKRLETLRPRIESCLTRICRKTPATLADFGILENERSFLLHGPLRLTFPDGELNAGLLQKPVRLGVSDLRRARLDPGTRRCLTVENAAMLHELAKTPENLLLVSSGSEGGYANSAVIEFLEMLPADIELWHFGDSDPKGFDVLRDMRQRSGRKIVSLHMAYRPTSHSPPLTIEDVKTIDRLITSDFLVESEKRELATMREEQTKGDFEQEHLGPPGSMWPFY